MPAAQPSPTKAAKLAGKPVTPPAAPSEGAFLKSFFAALAAAGRARPAGLTDGPPRR